MFRPRPEIYFLHIPKTAGTSLAGVIRNAYAPGQGIPAHEWAPLVGLTRDCIQRYHCFTGHFGTGLYSLLDRPIPTVTLLRDPFERSISQINHAARFTQPHPVLLPGKHLANIQTLYRYRTMHPVEKWLDSAYAPIGVEEYQTRTLGVDLDMNPLLGKPDEREFSDLLYEARGGEDIETILERAKRRLDGMAVVGTVERFEESVGLICEYLGIPPPATLPVENVSQGRAVHQRYRDSGDLPPHLIARIDELTHFDRELYAYANRLMDARIRANAGAGI